MSTLTKKVLLAEDSTVTQDLLTLILGQRGHEIDVANDGEETLNKLRENNYDIALVDYHLPIMTGLKAITTYLEQMDGKPIPKLVAMTSDTNALLSAGDDCEVFKGYLKKPISVEDVIPAIEAEDAIPSIYKAPNKNSKAADADAQIILPFSGENFNLVYYPNSFKDYQLRADIAQRIAAFGAPDAILILNPTNENDRHVIAKLPFAHITPIVDLTAQLNHRVDLSKSHNDLKSTTLRNFVDDFANKRSSVHSDLLKVENDSEALLVRIYFHESKYVPIYDPSDKQCISYPSLFSAAEVMNSANILVEKGLVKSEFFDRFFSCRSCSSNRMVVHEECNNCKSKNIIEEQYIHHYKCAHQAPEAQFRHGDRLICPKCRLELVNFGGDYDKPGTQHVCKNCGNASTDPAVGFHCLDCNDRTDGDLVATRDCFKFEITDLGHEFLQVGRMALGDFSQSLKFSDLPLEFVIKMNVSAKAYLAEKKEFCLISVGYKNQFVTEREHGIHMVQKAREALMSLIRVGVDVDSMYSMSKTTDYLLVQNKSKAQCEVIIEKMLPQIRSSISVDIEPNVSIFGPEDLSQ